MCCLEFLYSNSYNKVGSGINIILLVSQRIVAYIITFYDIWSNCLFWKDILSHINEKQVYCS